MKAVESIALQKHTGVRVHLGLSYISIIVVRLLMPQVLLRDVLLARIVISFPSDNNVMPGSPKNSESEIESGTIIFLVQSIFIMSHHCTQ